MTTLLWAVVYFGTFFIMEFVAWFSHKYIMHGFLWVWHKDHHKRARFWFERNDLFVVYALMSFVFVVLWNDYVIGQVFPLPWNFYHLLHLFCGA